MTEVIAPVAGAAVGVVGAGTMGAGIAYVFAMAGFPVVLVEPDAGQQGGARATLKGFADAGIARGKLSAAKAKAGLAGVTVVSGTAELPEGLALVIETVPERLALKRAVLAEISARNPAIIATNTSALSVDDLAGSVSDKAAFCGMHFFNPVPSLHLVELVHGTATSATIMARARGFAEAVGKTTVTVRNAPGFATSRLDLAQAMEAIRMVEEGVATPEDIDRAATTAYRHPVGPLRLSDLVGLDVRLDIARRLEQALGPHFAPPKLLQDMVARGELGRKSGKGFYDWPEMAEVSKG